MEQQCQMGMCGEGFRTYVGPRAIIYPSSSTRKSKVLFVIWADHRHHSNSFQQSTTQSSFNNQLNKKNQVNKNMTLWKLLHSHQPSLFKIAHRNRLLPRSAHLQWLLIWSNYSFFKTFVKRFHLNPCESGPQELFEIAAVQSPAGGALESPSASTRHSKLEGEEQKRLLSLMRDFYFSKKWHGRHSHVILCSQFVWH